ncbi:MAG: hypothetical protein IT204_16720 [Fimbriimonadaceae bacterium]|nr:hypothetical protein [Fimbriimonadaceae bacterium]
MNVPLRADCAHCGVTNELPAAALSYGQFRCHACGQVSPVPAALRRPVDQSVTATEPVQGMPSFVPSEHNTPEAMRRAEAEASRISCAVALTGWLLLAAMLWGGIR